MLFEEQSGVNLGWPPWFLLFFSDLKYSGHSCILQRRLMKQSFEKGLQNKEINLEKHFGEFLENRVRFWLWHFSRKIFWCFGGVFTEIMNLNKKKSHILLALVDVSAGMVLSFIDPTLTPHLQDITNVSAILRCIQNHLR